MSFLLSLLPLKQNKKVGETPYEILQKLELKTKRKFFHTGNLDPMARGLMLFIPTRFRFLEKKLKSLKKVYEFTIIQGFTTDSQDLLGLIINYDVMMDKADFKALLLKFKYSYKSQVPPQISRKNLKKAGLSKFLTGSKLKDLSPNPVKIYDVKFLGDSKLKKKRLYSYIKSSFIELKNDFRQDKILINYDEHLKKLPNEFYLYKFRIKVSGGFYIRALVRDLSEKIGVPLTTFEINRKSIGIFKL